MKTLANLMLTALFVLVAAQAQSILAQGTLERSILGSVVEQQENKDTGDRTVVVEVKLDTTVDGVELKLPDQVVEGAKTIALNNWTLVKGKGLITATSDLPTNVVRLRIDFPRSIADKLEKALKDGLELKFKLGDEIVGAQTFPVTNAAPPSLITDLSKVAAFPRDFFPGINSFSPYTGYTKEDGTWVIQVRTDKGLVDLPVSPVLTNQEYRTGVDYKVPTRNSLDPNNLMFPPKPTPARPGQEPFPPLGFVVPPDLPPGAALEIKYVDKFGNTVVGAKVTPTSFLDLGLPPFLITCTSKLFAGDQLCVCGFFPTQFSRNQLLLDGKPLGRLAGSRDTIVFQPKGLKPGRHVIEWDVNAFNQAINPERDTRQGPSNLDAVEFVFLEVQGTIDQNALFTGQGTTLRLKIIGSDERLTVQLDNLTPDIVELEGGASQGVTSYGGPNNVIEKRVRGLKRGNFNITYRLSLAPCPCNPELTVGFTKLAGSVNDAPDPKPDDQQPQETPDNCEQTFQECAKSEAEAYEIESEYAKALAGCSKGRGANDPKFYQSCFERTETRYQAKLREAYEKEELCYKRYQACLKSQQEALNSPPAGPVTNTPSNPTGPAGNTPSKGADTGPVTNTPSNPAGPAGNTPPKGTDAGPVTNTPTKPTDTAGNTPPKTTATGPSTDTPSKPTNNGPATSEPRVPPQFNPKGYVPPPNVGAPPSLVAEPGPCDPIKSECDGLREAIANTEKKQKEFAAYCDKEAERQFPEAENAAKRASYAKECKDNDQETGNGRDLALFKKRLADCVTRYQDCVGNLGKVPPPDPNAPGTPPQPPTSATGSKSPTTGQTVPSTPVKTIPNPDNQPPVEKRDCSEIARQCAELTESLARTNQRYQTQLEYCRSKKSEPGDSKEKIAADRRECIRLAQADFRPELERLERLLNECKESYRACAGVDLPATQPGDKSDKKDQCEEIEKECSGLAETGKRITEAVEKARAECEKYGADEQARRNCKNLVNTKFVKESRAVAESLTECDRRLTECRKKRRPQ